MDSVIKAFFSIKVDFSARTISVRSEGFRRFKEPACSHRKRRVFSCEKCVIKMENILLNLIINWLCCKNAQCMSVSGWSCNGEKKEKFLWGFCVCVCEGQIVFCAAGWCPSSLRRSICCALLSSAPGSPGPGRHLPRAAAAAEMTYHIRPGRMESRAIYCCLTGRVTDLHTPVF